jgi:hypothetical protein
MLQSLPTSVFLKSYLHRTSRFTGGKAKMGVSGDELANMFDSVVKYKCGKLIIHELDLALPQRL